MTESNHRRPRAARVPIPVAALVLTCLLTLTACGDDRPAAGTGGEMEFARSLEVDLSAMTRTATGLHRRDIVEGTGAEATPGNVVTVHYTGWLPDGMEFDSSRRRGDPFAFVLGVGEVIPGWDEGVQGMRVGGRRQLVIPPDLAYGPVSPGAGIPPNATLVFDVELLGVD